MKTLHRILAILAFAAMTAATATEASAQDKPKGKPWPAPENAVKMKNPV
ncbi:MAG: hypothetical protein JNL88_06780 [Bacteroidia bacterium]|nr:hypothetical protein [Bacteroidia bacterium]